jgi:hypothetical protein
MIAKDGKNAESRPKVPKFSPNRFGLYEVSTRHSIDDKIAEQKYHVRFLCIRYGNQSFNCRKPPVGRACVQIGDHRHSETRMFLMPRLDRDTSTNHNQAGWFPPQRPRPDKRQRCSGQAKYSCGPGRYSLSKTCRFCRHSV